MIETKQLHRWLLLIFLLSTYPACNSQSTHPIDFSDSNSDQWLDAKLDVNLDDLSADLGQSHRLLDASMSDIGLVPRDMQINEDALVDQAVEIGQDVADSSSFYIHLTLAQSTISGSHSLLDNGILLDSGASIRWSVDGGQIPINSQLSFSLKSRVWRVEDGQVQISSNLGQGLCQIWGNGFHQLASVRQRYDDWTGANYGRNALPPLLSWPVTEALDYIEISSINGGIIIGDLYLHDARENPLSIPSEPSEPPSAIQELEYTSCLPAVDCDDGAGLNALIAQVSGQASETFIKINLPSEQYLAQSSVVIDRSRLSLKGSHANTAAIWKWSPRPNSGQSWPFIFRGLGRVGTELQVVDGIEYGQRHIQINQVLDEQFSEQSTWLQLSAEDFGEVPPICINGRDIERRNRHQRQLFKVVDINTLDGHSVITLDRPVFVSIPAEAIPVLTPVSLLTDNQISHIDIQADCLASQTGRFEEANCQNREVIDDGAVLSQFTDGLKMSKLSATGFGKFTYEIRDSLRNVVEDCQMHYPSAYGSGGQGYGVHLIGASRTVISNLEVNHARHGVVIDFGSSDSQILNGSFSNMNQALLDVHGEASRDTLIRGNHLQQSSIGIIIGGGGRTVHCNDGPRHHVQLNHISDCGIAVLVSDETEKSYIKSNDLINNGTHIGSAYGAYSIEVERNRLESATIKPISVGFETTRDMLVKRNLFQGHCSPEEALLQLRGAEIPVFIDNLWCPSETSD